MQNSPGELRAFVLVRHNAYSWIVDLLLDYELVIGCGEEANIQIKDDALRDRHAAILWNGRQITLRLLDGSGQVTVNNEAVDQTAVVRPGDEIKVGDATMVVSIALSPITQGRRSLTHTEFCERMVDELSRALLRARPTCLVMLKAKSGDGSSIANAALGSFRGGDIVGTYAHDEIEFLLPDTPPSIAKAVVQRLLETAGAEGANVGLAVSPDDGDTPERLMRAARDALALSTRDGGGISRPRHSIPEPTEPSIHSQSTRLAVEDVTEAARTGEPALLLGEPSAGKRVYARLLHDRSPRAGRPFILISCASLVDPLAVDSAFGDSNGNREDCKAMRALGGTLVLDEVGELPIQGQKRLLDLLQSGALGSTGLVSTTHRDLAALSGASAFLEELYRHLAHVRVGIPALRMRAESIVPLAQNFAAQYTSESKVKLSHGAVEKMRTYAWPGNVLELRNAMERAVKLAGGGEILAEHLPGGAIDPTGRGQLRQHVGSVERDAIIKTLADNNYNQTHTARQLGISRRALIYKMEKYGLKPPPSSSRKDE